jgi:hypothetical protein
LMFSVFVMSEKIDWFAFWGLLQMTFSILGCMILHSNIFCFGINFGIGGPKFYFWKASLADDSFLLLTFWKLIFFNFLGFKLNNAKIKILSHAKMVN